MTGTGTNASDLAASHRRVRWCATLACALALFGCSPPAEPGHTFEIIGEDGVATAVSSAVPKYEGEIFRYEKILELRPDPDNFDETFLYDPRSFTLGDDGLYYVADTGNHRIAVFDAEGDFVRAFGREGQGPGELQGPITVRVRDGIATVRGRRKSRFRTDGTFVDLIPHEGRGEVYLADDGTRVVIDLPQGPQDDGLYYLQARARVLDEAGEVVATLETDQVANARVMPDTVMGRGDLHYAAWPHASLLPGNDRLIIRNMEYGASESLREQLLGMKASAQYAEHKGFWWLVEAEQPGGWIWLTSPVPRFGVYYRDLPHIEQQQSFRIVSPEGEYIGTTEWPPDVDRFATHVTRGHLLAMVADPEAGETIPTVYRITPAVDDFDYPGGR